MIEQLLVPTRKSRIAVKREPMVVPSLTADTGEQASWRYVEFFTANIRNPNNATRLRACVLECPRVVQKGVASR